MGVLGEGRHRWALAVLLGWIVLLILAPTAIAAGGTGKISGTVTVACKCEVPKPLGNIEVTVYETGGSELPVEVATTNEHGEYTVEGLPGGSYRVEFSPGKSGLNYLTQYYNDKSTPAAAEPVKVVQGETTKDINAKMRPSGEIKGTVTEYTGSEDIIPLQNIEVLVYEAGKSEFPVGVAITDEHGEYTVEGLPSGSYHVEFSPGKSGLNYVTQYYNDKSSLATAEPVKVLGAKATEGINAELQVGGEISGTVTDASTHAPLANVDVVAVGSDEAFAGVTNTNASGEYTILGLASGAYKIEFIKLGSGSPYITPQYYNDQPSLASANPVTANQGSTTPGIDAALVRKEPVNTAAPVVSGTPAVGKTLSCATGTWTGSPTLSYTYAWLRNGAAIAGASASTYVVQTADQGTGLACKVTATNKSASASAVSNTLTVPVAPPPPVPRPEVKLLSARILVSGGSARVPISCAKATCTGTIELTERIVVRRRHRGRTNSKRETVVLGKGVYALSAGHSATILVHLTRTGKKALARSRHHRLPVLARISVMGGTAIRGSVVLSEPVHRRRRR